MAFKQSLFMLKQKQKNIFYRNSLNETEHTFINQNSGLCGDVQGLPWVEWDFTEQELCSNSPDFARFWKIQGWFSPYICMCRRMSYPGTLLHLAEHVLCWILVSAAIIQQTYCNPCNPCTHSVLLSLQVDFGSGKRCHMMANRAEVVLSQSIIYS